jgi:hypothetical protein
MTMTINDCCVFVFVMRFRGHVSVSGTHRERELDDGGLRIRRRAGVQMQVRIRADSVRPSRLQCQWNLERDDANLPT